MTEKRIKRTDIYEGNAAGSYLELWEINYDNGGGTIYEVRNPSGHIIYTTDHMVTADNYMDCIAWNNFD